VAPCPGGRDIFLTNILSDPSLIQPGHLIARICSQASLVVLVTRGPLSMRAVAGCTLLSCWSLHAGSALAAGSGGWVSFWYYPPAYGGSDINATIDLLKKHEGVTTSVMLGCDHGVSADGGVVMPSQSSLGLCTTTIAGLKSAKVKPELVMGGSNITQLRQFFASAEANIDALVKAGKSLGATGWNLDIEPTTSVAADATLYANFLSAAKPKLNAAGMRLTIATATWSPMLADTSLLAPHVDRVLNMETYNADSMSGWLNGDAVGGYYSKFVAPPTAHSKLGPGLGCWPAKCGPKASPHPCWSTTAASGPPRMARIESDGLPEVALFRIIQVPNRPDLQWPEEWWWPLLAKFADGQN
jgi:hypothetical protein